MMGRLEHVSPAKKTQRHVGYLREILGGMLEIQQLVGGFNPSIACRKTYSLDLKHFSVPHRQSEPQRYRECGTASFELQNVFDLEPP